MEYGLIGEKLGHSFSVDIHSTLGDYDYKLKEIADTELEGFFGIADFKGLNVTIPYKQAVMPYLYQIDDKARDIGAVNTVVNRDGRLYGYNTDFFGLKALLTRIGIDPRGKKILILGTGGTSKTALAVVKDMGGVQVYRVGRTGAEGSLTYEEVYAGHTDADYIINTTPVGMYPKMDACPIELEKFESLKGVADVVYNPLRTVLVQKARAMGLPAEGGLYMLVAQGVAASELFLGKSYDADTVERVFATLAAKKENIVLTGMPASGKSTVGRLLAELLGREFTDTDTMVEAADGRPIPQIFSEDGEAAFRDMETEAVKKVAAVGGAVIATGGGAILRPENVAALKQNGIVVFLDRPLGQLVPDEGRPLSRSEEAIRQRYAERYGIYIATADIRIENSTTPQAAAEAVIKEIHKQ